MLLLRTNMCINHCCHACSYGRLTNAIVFSLFSLPHVRIHREKETCICTFSENSSILRISLPVYTYAMAMFLTFYRERRDLGSFLGFFLANMRSFFSINYTPLLPMSITQFIHSCFYYYGPSFPPPASSIIQNAILFAVAREGGQPRLGEDGEERCVRAMQQWTWVIALSLSLLLLYPPLPFHSKKMRCVNRRVGVNIRRGRFLHKHWQEMGTVQKNVYHGIF